MTKKVCIFCGANMGNDVEIIKEIESLCTLLAERDFNLVYGGGKDGVMGLIANKFLSHDREVLGIRPKGLLQDESAHKGITKMITVDDMHERKKLMMQNADYFIALAGGIGTLDEIIEVYTHVKIGFEDKFCALLNTNDYFNGLDVLLGNMVEKGYLNQEGKDMLHFSKSANDLLHEMNKFSSTK